MESAYVRRRPSPARGPSPADESRRKRTWLERPDSATLVAVGIALAPVVGFSSALLYATAAWRNYVGISDLSLSATAIAASAGIIAIVLVGGGAIGVLASRVPDWIGFLIALGTSTTSTSTSTTAATPASTTTTSP